MPGIESESDGTLLMCENLPAKTDSGNNVNRRRVAQSDFPIREGNTSGLVVARPRGNPLVFEGLARSTMGSPEAKRVGCNDKRSELARTKPKTPTFRLRSADGRDMAPA